MTPRPRPTFLTLPLEVRDVIYQHAIKTEEKFQVCQCPAHSRNSLGLCDFARRPNAIHELHAARGFYEAGSALPKEERHPPSNTKAKLALVCLQINAEVQPFRVDFPTLVFCDPLCFHAFMQTYKKTRIVDLLHRIEIILTEGFQDEIYRAGIMIQAATEQVDVVQQWNFMWMMENTIETLEVLHTAANESIFVGRFVLEREHSEAS